MPDVRWYSTGASTFSSGTAGTPGIRFTDDSDTGFFTRASNELNLSLGGTEEYRWSTATAYFSGNDIYLGDTLGATDGPLIRPAASPGIFFGGTEEYRIGSATFYLGSNDLSFEALGATNVALRGGATSVTLSAGSLVVPAGSAAAVGIGLGAVNTGLYLSSNVIFMAQGGNADFVAFDRPNVGIRLNSGYFLYWENSGGPSTGAPAAGSVGLTRATTATIKVVRDNNVDYGDFICRGLGLGQAPAASTYIVVAGVSGAGGTPTSTQLTSGDADIAVYAQQAHDAQATKFVIAYNSYNGLNYLSIPMDGTSTAWTHNQTRP